MTAEADQYGDYGVVDEEDRCYHDTCIEECRCGRGRYQSCRYRSCYECFLDRRADYMECIICGRWHSPVFDTCFKCRPEAQGRDDAAKALRQLILWRDNYECRTCGAREGDLQPNPRDPEATIHALLHVDHIVPCKAGGTADEWNLQVLCAFHNAVKGSTWYVGCRYEAFKTDLCAGYFLIARTYFDDPTFEKFHRDVALYQQTRTWDPLVHASILNELETAS